MEPPLAPPIDPMLAKLARSLPVGDYLYEPKWDGFRCLSFRSGAGIDMRSRHSRPMTRYFPELREALLAISDQAFVLDGEIIVSGEEGSDFPALLARLHPAASRVERLSRETPASFVAFDLLARGADDLRKSPFAGRRRALQDLLAVAGPPVFVTPATASSDEAQQWLRAFPGGGIDGVVAKRCDLTYQAGKRAMVKVKLERTVECAVAGFRLLGDPPAVSSLLLGLYDGGGFLRHVGVVTAFTEAQRHDLLGVLRPHVAPLRGHPWEGGFLLGPSPMGRLKGAAGRWTPDLELDWVPLRPELVCEVAYDQLDTDRFRHPARFRRWRPDRDPRSCTFDQLSPEPPAAGGVDLLGTSP